MNLIQNTIKIAKDSITKNTTKIYNEIENPLTFIRTKIGGYKNSPRLQRQNFPKKGRKQLTVVDKNKLDSAWFHKASLVNPTKWALRNQVADSLGLDRMRVHRYFSYRYQIRDLRHLFFRDYQPLPLSGKLGFVQKIKKVEKQKNKEKKD